ncbi:hypothetical protein F4678DRAFT_112687 [Xylaria arbuscula]|nr:hypothetical protein F4678DRAFT_112687 [Xylaria arbuscula]
MDTRLDASDSQGDLYPVYVGIWTNWSRGRVLGSTLTLNRRDADLIIAFTAFLIAFLATRTWRILCFTLHRFYSTADPQDAVYHQRQTIFRNSSSPENGLQMLLQLLWTNRRSKGWFRPLPAAIFTIVCVTLFTIAGGFSSQISTAVGSEVLIKSSNCGYTELASEPSSPEYFLGISTQATKTNSAANYAQQCYANNDTGLLDCDRFITKRVLNTMDTQASCPFKNHICRNESTNLRIDSGYIDSHDILSLNAPPNERILFRNVLHCAPLATRGFTHEKNTSLGTLTLYQYGNYTGYGEANLHYVHAVNSVESQYAAIHSKDITVGYANYALSVYQLAIRNETIYKAASYFDPIGEITRKDADIDIIFLSGNGVVFSQPSGDQWYLNTVPSSIAVGDFGPEDIKQLYVPREPASPLGCAKQYQFCNTAFRGTSGCGPLASLRDAIGGAAPFFDTTYADFVNYTVKSETGAHFDYFMNTFRSTSPSDVGLLLKQLGPTILTSQTTLNSAIQGPIASNQWQHDVSHWWDISMAIQQSALLDLPYIPDNSDIRSLRYNYTAPEYQKICNSQKIRSTAYGSFSLFGLFFTLVAGLLITLVSYLLEPIFGWLHKRKGRNQYPYLEWTTNATLQLHRLVHEEVGFGTWSEGTETIPITKPGEILGSLDITNPRHPVLRRPMDGDGVPLSAEGSETAETAIGDESEHTYTTPAPPSHASDAEQDINETFQEDLADEETQVEGYQPATNSRTVQPCDAWLDETAEPDHSENLPMIQIAQETPMIVSTGARV